MGTSSTSSSVIHGDSASDADWTFKGVPCTSGIGQLAALNTDLVAK
jgi:hypothetical protein